MVNKKKNLSNNSRTGFGSLFARLSVLIVRSRDIRGASIVIALSMIAAIMFFTIGMASTMIMAIQNTSDSKKAVQAEYAAQAGVEMVNLFFKNIEPATDLTVVEPPLISSQDLYSGVNVTLEAYGRDLDTGTVYSNPPNYRSVPLKGYGNASSNCQNLDDADAPCNWNKLFYGDSVEIPLYYIGEEGPVTAIHDFNFKLRAPCSDGTSDSGCTRYPIESGQTMKVVINWQFMGESCANTSCVINGTSDTLIEGNDIKDAFSNSYVILKQSSLAEDSTNPEDYSNSIIDFLTGNNVSVVKPKFKFSYVQALEGENNTSIPYLEYQFIYTPASDPLAAMYRTKITGNANGVQYQLNGVQGLGAGLFDFAVQN